MKRYYLISTSHLCDRILFLDDKDFTAAMNLVAVTAHITGTCVITFVLMSNHVHFILYATKVEAISFIERFKHLYSMYFRHRYGPSRPLKGNSADIREVSGGNESTERAIAYVQMNPVAANICPHPSLYPWGCGCSFFNPKADRGRTIESISVRSQRTLLHSNVRLPGDYVLLDEGFISPRSYIPIKKVESVFRTSNRYNFFLNNSSKAKSRMEDSAVPSFRDQVINNAIQDLCHSLFRTDDFKSLNNEDATDLLKQLRWRFSADIAQLARITGLPYRQITAMIESL